jgi:hypothetical protein
MSLVFQNIDPPPIPGECVPPVFVGGEDTLARQRGGWGVNIWEDARHRIGLLQYNLSTVARVDFNQSGSIEEV